MIPLSRTFLVLTLLIGACDCTDAPPVGCNNEADCEAGEQCIDQRCVPRSPLPDAATDAPDQGMPDLGTLDAGPECVTDDMCDEGVCLAGSCCISADNVCGDVCCGGDETCFANTCVTPGGVCASATDCADGEYCEIELGDTPEPDPMMACTSARTGRCLALPPSCDDAAAGDACIRTDCEFRPEPGDLDAVPQWRWDPSNASQPGRTDVWSTPVVGRLFDTNCDGRVDALDPSAIIFVSNDTETTYCSQAGLNNCKTGTLHALDGSTGRELWLLDHVEGSAGFSGTSAALGDLDDDGVLDIVVFTGEGRLAAIRGDGTVMAVSDFTSAASGSGGFGWGGGISLADMDGDGDPELAYAGDVFRWSAGGFSEVFRTGQNGPSQTSFLVNLDEDDDLEFLVGGTAYDSEGTRMWRHTSANGFSAVADFDMDGAPDVIHIQGGVVSILEGATGVVKLGPLTLDGTGSGGPPTIADFDGDGLPEIGVAQANRYSMLKPDFEAGELRTVWATLNHDNSSSVTGSTVFDFEGDGVAEVIYADECFLWVYDGPTGAVRFVGNTMSFTGTEASLVADVDGDGHAEIVMVSNGADPTRWTCAHHTTGTDDYPVWTPPEYGPAWRGITVFRDRANSWVGTRSLWTQHAYYVSNVCDDRDSACEAGAAYGAIPQRERSNWTVPWLNNFRQNVQDQGLFNAPDARLSLRVDCSIPLSLVAAVLDQGPAPLPAGVVVGFYIRASGMDTLLGTATTTSPILPGRAQEVSFDLPAGTPGDAVFVAKIEIDEDARLFVECDETNNESDEAMANCLL